VCVECVLVCVLACVDGVVCVLCVECVLVCVLACVDGVVCVLCVECVLACVDRDVCLPVFSSSEAAQNRNTQSIKYRPFLWAEPIWWQKMTVLK